MHETRPVAEAPLRAVKLVSWVYIALGAAMALPPLWCLASWLLHSHLGGAARAVGTPGHPGAVLVQHGSPFTVGHLLGWVLALVLAGVLIGGGVCLLRRRESGRVALVVASWIVLIEGALGLLGSIFTLLGVFQMPEMVRQTMERSQPSGNLMLGPLLSLGVSLLLLIGMGVLIGKLSSPGLRCAMRPPPRERQ